MRSETLLVLSGWLLAMLLFGLWEMYPKLFEGICVFLPGCGTTIVWSRHGNRIWQRAINTRTETTIRVTTATDDLAVSITTLNAPADLGADAPTVRLTDPGLSNRADAAQCPNDHVTCQPLHGNCCPRGKDCCGLGCCPDGARCVDEERGRCCPRAAVLCGDKCVRGTCCAGGALACPNEGETCCGRVADGDGDDDGNKWHREMRCCKSGEYCHAGRECRRETGEESRGVEGAPGSAWAWAVCALAAIF